MKFPIVTDDSEWPESKPRKANFHGEIEGEASGSCKRQTHTSCSGFRRTWLPYGYFDDPCTCACHDHVEKGYKPRLEAHRESGHQGIGPLRPTNSYGRVRGVADQL